MSTYISISQRIEEIKRRNAELQEQIKQQTAEIERQQTQWQRLADAVRSNNVPAVKQLSQQTDEATRRLRMDAAKGSINGIKAELDQLADSMAIVEGDADSLKAKLDDLRNRQAAGDTSVTDAMIAETEALYHKASDELASMKEEYNSMTVEQKKYIDQLKEANGHHARLRTEIMDTREQMARLIAEGQAGTPAFRQLAEQAGDMRRQMALANATMQYFANPTRHLETLKTGLQGVAGAASLVTGVMGVFNTNSEKMAEIQTKIQSYLGIIVGLESTYATVKKTSNLMQAVGEVQAWAMAKAKAAEVTATEAGVIATGKATAAQALFNAVAKANPYLLLATGIGLAVTAIYMLVKAFSSEEETAITAEEAIKKHNETMKDTDRELTVQVENMLNSYRILQAAWRNLGNDMDSKNQFIANNQHAFEDLGLTIKSVGDAEVYLRKENESCVDAIVGKAQELIAENKRWRDSVANTASGQMFEYAKLQRKWNELGDDMKAKKKFVEDNKTAFQNLGFAVGSVTDAENILVQNTEAVVASIMARAKAAAYYDRMKELMAKNISEQEQIDIDTKRRQNDVQNTGIKISSEEYYRLVNANKLSKGGYDYERRSDGSKNYQQRYEWGDVYTSGNDFYLTQEGLKKYQQIKKQEIDAQAEQAKKRLNDNLNENLSYLQEGLTTVTEENKKILANAGIQEWKGGGGGGTTKGKTPDEITKDLIAQEQEASRQRQQNLLLQEQAVIDQMDDGAEKELAQMRLNHKKRMVELNNEEQDILNKKIEAASKDSKGRQRKGFYTTGQYKNVQLTEDEMLGVNSKRMSEMVSMFDAIAKSSANTEDRMIALRQAYSDFVSDVEDSSGNKLVSDDAFANIEAQFKRVEAGIRREEFTAMREYLREYGSYEQQRLAITQDYEERIKRAKTEGERLTLQKERDKALSSQSFESISMGIDWSALLNGVGNLSQEMLRPMLEQLQAYTKTDQFNQADIQEREKVVELINELKKYVGTDQNATWQQLSTAINNFTQAVGKYKEADAQEKQALQNLVNARGKLERGEISQDDFDRIEREARELGARTVEARDEMQQLGRTLNETSDEVKGYVSPLTTALQKMSAWQGVEGFSGLQNGVAQFDQLKGTLDSILPSMGDGMAKTIGSGLSSALGSGLSVLGDGLSSVMSSGIGSIIGIVAQIPRMILQLADAIKNMVTGILDAITELLKFEWLSDLVNSILEAIGNLIDAIFDLPEHLFNAISSIVVDGIGGLVDGVLGRVGNVLSFGLLSSGGPSDWFTNSNAAEVAETTERLTEENEKLRNSIDGLCEEIKSDGGSKSIKSAQEALEANRQYIENQREILDAQQGYHSAHHSNAYYWDLGREHQNQVNALLAEYAKRNNKTASRVNSDWGTFAALSPEEMDYIRNHNLELWKQLEDIGKYDKSEFFEAFADLAGSEKEILDSLNEALTQTSFDSLKSNFISNLMDMERSAEDFSEDFTNMMMQAVLNARISDLMDKEIQDFYDKWAELSKDSSGNGYELTKTELDTLSKMWDDIINHGMQIRDEVAAVTGYDQTNAAKQEADKKGFAAMSQDTGEELNGRFTAVQIAGENVSAQANAAMPLLAGMGASASRTAELVEGIGRVADDMLTNMVECYTELNMIRMHTEVLVEQGKKHTASLQKIADSVKNI